MMAKQRIAHTNKIYPLGGSPSFFDRQDERRADESADDYADDVPAVKVLPSVKESPAYKALLRQIEQLQQQVANLQAENNQLKLQPAVKRTSTKSRKPVQRFTSPDEITIDGVRYVSAEWIGARTGLHQSNVSRKLAKLEVTPDRVEGSKYYYRKSKLPEIENKRKR